MERLHYIFATILLLLAALTSSGAVVAAEAGPAIRVITYNVQFLPGQAGAQNERKDPEYRARRIAEEISGFDIVALQETFDEGHRAILVETLREAWGNALNMVVSPKPEGFFANGGCLILTRLPILESDAGVYEHFSNPADFGFRADGFAAKGVIFARIARSEREPETYVDVFATHLEARADHLRAEQYKEMAAFIRAKSDPTRPMILVGDLNTRGMVEHREDSNSQYNQLMRALENARPGGVIDLWPSLMGDTLGGTSEQESSDVGKRIDYILLSNPSEGGPALNPLSIQVNTYRDDRVYALSDHNAVEATLAWSDP